MIFLWVALYGLVYLVSQKISQEIYVTDWVTALAMMIYVGLLLFWIFRTGKHREVNLGAVRQLQFKNFFYFAPLALLPIYNIVTADKHQIGLSAVVFMLSVSLAEEVFFRGFMLRFFIKKGKLSAILLTSACFALFHCVNLAEYSDFTYILMQVLCAFAVGICYGAVTIKFESLIPCFIAHTLTNVTGILNPAYVGQGEEMWGLLICIAAYAFYGIWLCRKIR